MCETQASTLHSVFSQGDELTDQYRALEATVKREEEIKIHHYCVVNPRPKWMEASAYPDLAFCAQVRQTALGGASWANYKGSKLETKINRSTLIEKTAINLGSEGCIGVGLEPAIAQYLQSKGKIIDPKIAADNRVLSTQLKTS